ncbi:hypothetical protein LCGC14_1962250 [marine sediment metagenome]|uniref:Uncharacterized protein n=1 Tax=marine sediment metagenome TaxID=412755 RepID=A0A0F9FE56_9ZZZZ
MLQTILTYCQPLTVIVFVVSGIVSLLLGLKVQGAINLCLAVTNLFIFYGAKFLR